MRMRFLSLAGLLLSTLAFAQDMPLSQVLIEGEAWQLVGEGYKYTEGPAVDATGRVFFTDVPNSKIYKIDLDGKVSTFVEESQQTGGLIFGADGKLYGCRRGAKQIVAYDATGEVSVVAADVEGNDLVATRDGGIYFTEPSKQQVWYISSAGEKRVVDKGIAKPNGVILWPDQKTLVVADTVGSNLWAYRIQKDGGLMFRQPYYTMRPTRGKDGSGADGMTVDTRGRLYVATYAGLQMFDSTGRISGVILSPQNKRLSNVVFGGPKLDTLYVTCTDKVYRRQTKATGVRYFDTK